MTESVQPVPGGRHLARDESLRRLDKVVADSVSGSGTLRGHLQACQHVCRIMKWESSRAWFDHQIAGYPAATAIDEFRVVHGQSSWNPEGQSLPVGTYGLYGRSLMPGAAAVERLQNQRCTYEARESLDLIQKYASTGFAFKTGRTEIVASHQGRSLVWEESQIYDALAFHHILQILDHYTFEFASNQYALLAFGDVVTNVWDEHLARVEVALTDVGLGQKLGAIRSGFETGDPEAERYAVLGCRTLLEDLAAHLWRDPRATYDLLKGGGAGNKLSVTPKEYVNRLRAYLHQKSITGNKGKFYAAELDRLADSISALNSYQSAAHAPMDEPEMQLVLLSTILVVGAIAIKTDMQPITEYSEISKSPSHASE